MFIVWYRENWKCGHSGEKRLIGWRGLLRSDQNLRLNVIFNRNVEGHDKVDHPYVSYKRRYWRRAASFGRQDAGVGAHMVRIWNGSETHLCVVRRNLLVGATVNCRYHVQGHTRASGCVCTGFELWGLSSTMVVRYILHVPQTFWKEWAKTLGSWNVWNLVTSLPSLFRGVSWPIARTDRVLWKYSCYARYPEVTATCRLLFDHVVGPTFFEEPTTNKTNYQQMLPNRAFQLPKLLHVISQQDRVPLQ